MAAAKKTTKKATKKPATKTTTKKKTSKAESQITRSDRLEALQRSINSKFKGRTTLQKASEFSNVFLLRRPTGITSLDIAIAGGFPAGGLSHIVGAESVGKDYLTNRVIAQLQAIYGEEASVCLAMSEMHFDKAYGKMCGARIAMTPEEIEDYQRAIKRDFTPEEMVWAQDQVGHVNEIIGYNAEEFLEATAMAIESNLYQVVVINSFGALLTKAEQEADQGIADRHYGGAAGSITRFMHRVHSALNKPDELGRPNLTTVIGINQYRENLGPDARYNPLNIAGGRALKHGKLVDVLLKGQSKIRTTINNKTVMVGKEIHWQLLKGKAGCHDGPTGFYPFYFGEHGYPFGADVYQDLIITGVELGVIQMGGPWISYQDDNYDLRAQGKERFSHLIAEQGAFDYLRQKCMDAAGVKYILKESNVE